VDELVKAKSRDRSISTIWEGTAELELQGAPNEEHVALAPVRMGKGFRFTFAYTVDDLETVRDLSNGAA
jgi:acetoacetate decarboxylase